VDFVIPGNDDAIRAVNLITRVIADACVEGRAIFAPATEKEAAAPAPAAPVVEPAAVDAPDDVEASSVTEEPVGEIETEVAEAVSGEVEVPNTGEEDLKSK
jgi:small subunit ribosomal protein S2